ncbi:MAG: hypothetical protein H8E66_24265 [Planctomycetes bacterium]|nr:hypothetical protein [Planctomycetota bacterium]
MTIESRLQKLESQNRNLKCVLLAFCLATGCAFLLGATDNREVEVMTLRAQKLQLIDPLGKVIGTWGSTEGAAYLNMESANGDAKFSAACADSQSVFIVSFQDKETKLFADEVTATFWARNPNTGNAFLKANNKTTELSLTNDNNVMVYCGASPRHGANYILFGEDPLDGSRTVIWDAVNGR